MAFQNVANALVAIERDADTLRAALAAQKTAAASLAVAKSQYSAGAGTYLNVLTAQQSDYSARLTLITARAARFSDTVALFQALGGGWWNRVDARTKTCRRQRSVPMNDTTTLPPRAPRRPEQKKAQAMAATS